MEVTLALMTLPVPRVFSLLLCLPASLALGPAATAGTYLDWVHLHFSGAEISAGLASPLCDHDGDNCPNIVEYFGGLHPKSAASSFVLSHAEDPVLGEVTVQFPADPGCSDLDHVVLVSNDLATWHEAAVFICSENGHRYHLNGHRYVKVGVLPKPGVFIDTDADGLLDTFEEFLIASDNTDPFQSLADILPDDDFDNDGTLNIDEPDNSPAPAGSNGKPDLIPAAAVACALDALQREAPAALLVHTPLQ